ncbi:MULTISPECIES: CopD family protein [Herbaspirillum]|uniref:Integral membrane protein n=1 Tax=Herbaspirillum seropedicae (strain SmR1) TaxID=757424 RepID=D8IXR3_HERSS|nr:MULTISPECIES: CopD family protein [Herbaspirillum]ADJ64165.1 integral membrane protein [Herbaspirillum seropedicae SmR1]AKN66124.1 membrane protein [Herbaspirillum seropedicae]AON55005.1 integral membrane protein [Herbaspirillum seropedicae]MDR6393941.1 putative membrane protein [Herbaspirillum seropedicae]NQE30789.1 membrane protein [Herbaspirillum seropedicae]
MLIAKFFHLLGLTIWVGGMFFAHMALRPALAVLHPEQRLTLMAAVLASFFVWVWIAIALVLGSGLHMMAMLGAGHAPPYVHAMTGIGVVMMLIFAHIFFAPFRRLKLAAAQQDWDRAARALGQVRQLVSINLLLGLLTIAIGALGPLSA